MDVSHLDWGVSVTRFLSFIENFTATCTFTHVVSHTLVCVSISKHECVSLRRNSSKFFLLSSFVYAFLFNSHMKEGECARALEGFTHQKWKRRQFDTLLRLLGTQSLLYTIVLQKNFLSVFVSPLLTFLSKNIFGFTCYKAMYTTLVPSFRIDQIKCVF